MDESQRKNIILYIALMKEEGAWIAQCLQHDIQAKGRDISSALFNLDVAIKREEDFRSLPPAPDRFFRLFIDNNPEVLWAFKFGEIYLAPIVDRLN